MQARSSNEAIRYEVDEPCPFPIAISVGLQGVLFAIATLVLVVAITARAGGQDESYLTWALFAALIIAGSLTALQGEPDLAARRRAYPHHGHQPGLRRGLRAGPSSRADPRCSRASSWPPRSSTSRSPHGSPLLRRILTPAVSGTLLMLIAVTILPIALDRVQEMPASAPAAAGPTVALVTLVATTALALRASGIWRLWSPLIGIGAGCIVAALFGGYDVQRVLDAPWAGIPDAGLPGFDLSFGAGFWALLPVFVVIALVGAVKNIGDSVAMQQASRRRPRVTDFRVVQASLNTNGLGILLSGVAGAPPTAVYSSTSVSLASLTGVASRRVGWVLGAILVVLAFFPKLTAVLLTIPSPVMGAFLLTALALLFVGGVRTVVQDGLDSQKVLVVGVAFSLGAGLDQQTIFADLLGGTWGPLLDNGMLTGAIRRHPDDGLPLPDQSTAGRTPAGQARRPPRCPRSMPSFARSQLASAGATLPHSACARPPRRR